MKYKTEVYQSVNQLRNSACQ